MPSSESSFPVRASDDMWHQHKAQIRDLYQNQRKTLKEIKHIMELRGFPEKPLSTWETKTRDVLKLRKKAKATDWHLIYQHVLPRLQLPGQKQLRKKTAIYLNDSEIPWNKAWKEIRRSGAIALPLRQRSPSPLPSGITIRTPSPVREPTIPTARGYQPTSEVVTSFMQESRVLTRDSHSMVTTTEQIHSIGDGSSRQLAQYAVSVYQNCAATIPWVDLYNALQYLFYGAYPNWRLYGDSSREQRELLGSVTTHRIGQAHSFELSIGGRLCLDLLPAGYPMPPRPSHDLGCRVATSAARLQLGQFISTTMYLLSNSLHDRWDGDKGLELFCSILERDVRQTTKLLHRRLPSIQTAHRSLLWYSVMSHRKDTFRLLIDVGIRNAWLDPGPASGSLLDSAVEMNCNDAIVELVTYCCRSGSDWWTGSFGAIVAAIRNGNDECARLLVEHCDFNTSMWWLVDEDSLSPTRFMVFIYEVDIQNDGDVRALEFLLEKGADVDQPYRFGRLSSSTELYCGKEIEINDDLHITILDHSFYFNRPLYERLAPYSKVSASDISRTGILRAAKDGTTVLKDYMRKRVAATRSFNEESVQSYLELVLAEQFLLQDKRDGRSSTKLKRGCPSRPYREIDLDTVRAFVQYGVDLTLPSINVGIQDLLAAVLRQLSRHCTDDGLELIAILVANGASIIGPQLRMAVDCNGFNVLECLALLVEDFSGKAVLALAEAARLNNFEAVRFLVRAGVDPNSFVPGADLGDKYRKDLSYSIQAIAAGCDEDKKSSSCDMIKLLAEHGAGLVVTPNDSSPFEFIRHLLRYSCSDTVLKAKYAIQVLRKYNSGLVFPPYLLESCVNPPTLINHCTSSEAERKGRLELFEYLLDQGAPVYPGSCLAAVIREGGPDELVERVVRSGADLNAFYVSRAVVCLPKCTPLQAAAWNGNEHLVHLLLKEGSSVNSRACGPGSMTALQAICLWDTATEEEYDRKLRICQLLISHGADINAAPAIIWGSTALQNAAIAGHLEVASLLLRNGARVNAPSCGRMDQNALDCAVFGGRLDMVKFLLNANALSYVRGATGYDGAIKLGERQNHSVLADLIREHAANNMALGLMNPELLKPQQDYRIYGYIMGNGYSDGECKENEHCTMSSLCRYCSGTPPD